MEPERKPSYKDEGMRFVDDANIIELYFHRDEEAIRHTSGKYGASCHKTARRILRDLRDVEECVSDTWIHTWNSIPPKRPSFLGAFVIRIARNLALDRYDHNIAEKRGTALTEAFDELADSLPAVGSDGDLTSELAFRDFLNGFLRSLSPTARRYFLLRYWYGMSIQEIAKEDHVSEGKVASMLFRTRKRLREGMERERIEQ